MSGERPYRDVTLSQVYWTATMASKGKEKENQSRSVAGFRAFTIERRTEDDVPEYLKGAATWLEIRHEEGYWIFDSITTEYHAAEYDELQDQWYFVRQDPRTRQWVAVAPVPANYDVGRRVKPTRIRAADVDDSNAPESSTSGQRNVPTQSLGQHNVPTTQSLGQHNVPTVNPLDIHRIWNDNTNTEHCGSSVDTGGHDSPRTQLSVPATSKEYRQDVRYLRGRCLWGTPW